MYKCRFSVYKGVYELALSVTAIQKCCGSQIGGGVIIRLINSVIINIWRNS